jgi:prepilin-type N-terminal cleavage/methylation domain-containing protein/prepilin-type processing-associated H-X9-DG protein
MNRVRHGLTIMETLISLAVLAVIVAILYPIFAQFHDRPHHGSCTSNLRQIGMGLLMYAQDYDETFPNHHMVPAGKLTSESFQGNSWKSLTHPYLKNPSIFACPQNPSRATASDDPEYKISYAANTARNPRDYPYQPPTRAISRKAKGSGVFGMDQSPGVKMSDIRSPEECISVVEVAHLKNNEFCVDIAADFTVPDSKGKPQRVFSDVLFTKDVLVDNQKKKASNYLLVDGHVKMITPTGTYGKVNFWYRDGSPLSDEGKLTLQNAEARTP